MLMGIIWCMFFFLKSHRQPSIPIDHLQNHLKPLPIVACEELAQDHVYVEYM